MRIVDDALPDPQRRMLLQATAEQIKHTLEAAGAQLGDGWAEGLQRGVRRHTGGRKVSYRQVGAPRGALGMPLNRPPKRVQDSEVPVTMAGRWVTHEHAIRACEPGRKSRLRRRCRDAALTPLYSNTTLVSFFPTLAMGGTAILMRRFDVLTFLALVERQRVTHAMLVPIQCTSG